MVYAVWWPQVTPNTASFTFIPMPHFHHIGWMIQMFTTSEGSYPLKTQEGCTAWLQCWLWNDNIAIYSSNLIDFEWQAQYEPSVFVCFPGTFENYEAPSSIYQSFQRKLCARLFKCTSVGLQSCLLYFHRFFSSPRTIQNILFQIFNTTLSQQTKGNEIQVIQVHVFFHLDKSKKDTINNGI